MTLDEFVPMVVPSLTVTPDSENGSQVEPVENGSQLHDWEAEMIAGVPEVRVMLEVIGERAAQDAKWGQQNHPDGTGCPGDHSRADRAKWLTDAHAKMGTLTWRDILDEEVQEAYAETDPALLRAELLQVAAVATAWVECIDRRTS